jgi:hypothetical protein
VGQAQERLGEIKQRRRVQHVQAAGIVENDIGDNA